MSLKKNPATCRQSGRTHHIRNHHFPSFSSNQDKTLESIAPSGEQHPASELALAQHRSALLAEGCCTRPRRRSRGGRYEPLH